jgi:hypothetical protein
MPTTLTGLLNNIDECMAALQEQSRATMETISQRASSAVDEAVPVGLWGTPYLKNAFKDDSGVQKNGEIYWFAQGNKESLPEPNKNPPPNTIEEFIQWWRLSGIDDEEERKRKRKGNGGGRVALLPWWGLSRLQKETLEGMRSQGMFGGEQDVAPYWWVQEVGSGGLAGVKGQKYFSNLTKRTNAIVRYWIGFLNKSYLKNIEK